MSVASVLVLVLILVVMLIGALPTFAHSRRWGFTPSVVLGLSIAALVALLLMGRL